MTHTTLREARAPIRLWTDPDGVEPAAMSQLYNIANLPWTETVAAMPDVHLGKGATVGSVIAMRDAVSPAAVGVDIGCGVTAVATSLTERDLPGDLAPLRRRIERAVPVGFASHDHPVDTDRVPGTSGWREFWDRFDDLHPGVRGLRERAHAQMGTLGGGNHFIEVCVQRSGDRVGTVGRVWLVLHSGSRNIGKELAERHMAVARELPHNADLPDRDLAVFVAGTPEMAAYRHDLYWAQEYAWRNRATMVALVQDAVTHVLPRASFEEPISCHHNYVAEETHAGADVLVTRKGAIRAGRGDIGVIPGSMGTGTALVYGLGNQDSYCSAAHGAGRRMSRARARKRFTRADLAAQTAGVECRKDKGVIDEIPAAYKDITTVLAEQSDLVEPVARLDQVICVKG